MMCDVMSKRVQPHRHARRNLTANKAILEHASNFAPNKMKTSSIVSPVTTERSRLGHYELQKQYRRPSTFHGDHRLPNGKQSHQQCDCNEIRKLIDHIICDVLDKPVMPDSDIQKLNKLTTPTKPRQINKNVSFGHIGTYSDRVTDRELINSYPIAWLVLNQETQPIQEMHSLDDDIVREYVLSNF